ncbi:MAG: Hsp70 family protein [Pseudomonadales bacterium]|nr:Hsp70 family protein [Pseudomonadales bacterium]
MTKVARIGVGIDFGTTNSTAAVFDGENVSLIGLESDSPIMPSATYIDADLQTITGQAAIDRYIEGNTGRTVELVPEVIGRATLAVGAADPSGQRPAETLTHAVYGASMIDTGLRGRLFRGTKRLLGNERVQRLMVFDHPFRLVALITPILLRIRQELETAGIDVSSACVGHPVNFEGRDVERNEVALSRLGEAYGHAGVKDHRFYPEPIAAAVSFLHEKPAAAGDVILTVDFGGGTLDFCVLERRSGSDFSVVATHGIALGGDHIDQRIFSRLLFPLLGKGERWRRRGTDRQEIETQFPFEDYEDLLLNWAVTYLLNQNRYTTPVLECISQGGEARLKFRRLRELIQQNYSYLAFQGIKDFKAELSFADSAVLDIAEIDIEAALTRVEFEDVIDDSLTRVEQAVLETIQRANIVANDVDIVLRTGGSSLIPAVHHLLNNHFPDRVVDHDPFTSVAAGLAIADYHDYQMG